MPLAMIAEKEFAGRQALGKRAEQEDAYAFAEIPARLGAARGLLLIVADGMGGHTAGSRASDLAVRAFATAFPRGGETVPERCLHALDIANAALAAAIEADPDHLEGMGTTLLAAVITPLGLEWISVGDSPLYLLRRGELRRINADHSFRPVLREMVERGELTTEQAATSSLRNRLRSALTGSELLLIDASPAPLPLLEGDVILAASDGLQTLNDAAIAEVLLQNSEADAAQLSIALVRAVLAKGLPKQDNTTAAIVKPPADWLLEPFGFAERPPIVVTDDSDDATHRVIPRASTAPLP